MSRQTAGHPSIAESIEIAVSLRRAHVPYRKIALILNEGGHLTLRSKRWTTQSVYVLLRKHDEFATEQERDRRAQDARRPAIRVAVRNVIREARRAAIVRMRVADHQS